jgi:TonB family protein
MLRHLSVLMKATTAVFNTVAASSAPARRGVSVWTQGEPFILSVLTLVLWVSCLAVGWIGFTFPYARPLPKPAEVPVIAQRIQVELTSDPLPPAEPASTPPDPVAPPPLPDNTTVPTAPPLLAVAEPSPAIAFALPVEGPVRVVEAAQAAFVRPVAPVTPAPAPAPAAQPLTYGQGEGRQPAPSYPLAARRQGQEGTVLVRFTVGENGRVLAAEAAQPSPWPLLNDAALEAVRERWRFRAGPVRVYEVAIQFVLKK